MNNNILAVAAMLACAATVQAQDISTQIVVDRTIQPTVREVSRPASFNPTVTVPKVQLQPLPQREYLQASTLTVLAPTLTPARYADSIQPTPYRGYLSAGYFPIADVGVSAGYTVALTRSTDLSVWGQFDNQRYKGYAETADQRYSSIVGAVAAKLTQRMGAWGILSLDLRYTTGKMGLPSYGYHTTADAPADTTHYNRRFDQLSATLGWHGHAERFRYYLHVTPGHFGYTQNINWAWYDPAGQPRVKLQGAAENSLEAAGGIEADFGATVAGIGLSTHWVHTLRGVEGEVITANDWNLYTYVIPENANVGVTAVNPYIKRQFGALYARLGLEADMHSGVSGSKFHVAPDVNIAWTPGQFFTAELTATGGSYMNTLERMRQLNPAGPAVAVYNPTYVPVDGRLTLTVGPASGFGMKLFGGWSQANNWLSLSYDPAMRVIAEGEQSAFSLRTNARNVVYNPVTLHGFMGGATLSYDLRRWVHLEATAMAAERTRARGYYQWNDRARYVIQAGLSATPIDQLTFGFNYELRAGRRAYDVAGVGFTNLHNISNLGFHADYALTDQINIWAKVDNLLNHRYLLQPYTPAQGVRGLVGAAYKF